VTSGTPGPASETSERSVPAAGLSDPAGERLDPAAGRLDPAAGRLDPAGERLDPAELWDPASGRGVSRLRVVSYNVRDLRDDRAAVARVVRACRPDVLCLQEAPRRTLTLCRMARLVRETGLRHVVGGRGSGGTAVLVGPRVHVLAAESARLPVAHLWTRTRGYALAQVRLPDGADLTVASLHLPLAPADRVQHSRRVRVRLQQLASGPVVVCGDLNEPPGGPAWTTLGELVHDPVARQVDISRQASVAALSDGHAESTAISEAPTYPAKAPRHRIDAVLVSEDVRVMALRPAGEAEGLTRDDLVAASDHLPLVADLELTALRVR
jgi:endonuclease/exonuclease/phosphatase family metal-dependent hydrolase